jgi:PhnB protein
MVDNPPKDTPTVVPYLLYEDLDSALSFLTTAFGLTETVRMNAPDGHPWHAELRLGDGLVMMGQPERDYRNPKSLGGATSFTYFYVDDVDAHCAAAQAAGASITRELADQPHGDRMYQAEDPEGHSWAFAQHVRDVAPKDMRLRSTE